MLRSIELDFETRYVRLPKPTDLPTDEYMGVIPDYDCATESGDGGIDQTELSCTICGTMIARGAFVTADSDDANFEEIVISAASRIRAAAARLKAS